MIVNLHNVRNLRIETLDWLRGLMALSIMFYHLLTFVFLANLDASYVLGRLGIYAVSIFFILSGLCMAMVYHNYINSIKTSYNFLVRRVFRIFPLYWLANVLTQLGVFFVKSTPIIWALVALHLPAILGFIKPGSYFVIGGWSIADEVVFYILTPIIVYLFNLRKWLGNMVFVVTLIIGLLFAFMWLDPHVTLKGQWSLYINPFNHLFLYVMGIAIYYNLKDVAMTTKTNMILLCAAVTLFCLLPFKGSQTIIATGMGRVIFTLLSFVIVVCFYKMKIHLPKLLRNFLTNIGMVSYGIYLYHPIVYTYVNQVVRNSPILVFCSVPIATFFIAKYSYLYFELALVRIGKRLTFATPPSSP